MTARTSIAWCPAWATRFPSGHVLAAVALWGLMPLVVSLYTRRRWVWWLSVAVSGGLILGIAASRVYLGVHWFTDVSAGFIVGTFFLLAVDTLVVRQRARYPCSRTSSTAVSGRWSDRRANVPNPGSPKQVATPRRRRSRSTPTRSRSASSAAGWSRAPAAPVGEAPGGVAPRCQPGVPQARCQQGLLHRATGPLVQVAGHDGGAGVGGDPPQRGVDLGPAPRAAGC